MSPCLQILETVGKAVPFNGTEAYGKIRYTRIDPFILHPALDGGEWSTSHPGRLKPMEGPRYPINKRKDGRRAGMDLWRREKFPSAGRIQTPVITS